MKGAMLVGLGGFAGSIFRYLVQVSMAKYVTVFFPLGTLLVNITGCCLIGVLYGLATRHEGLTIEWRLFLVTGICGGYTTFSTFSYEAVGLLKEGNYLYFGTYVGLSVVVGLLATIGGFALCK